MFRLRAEAKALHFEMLAGGEPLLYIAADEAKLRQVMINLVGNAIKFTKRGEVKLDVGLKAEDSGQLWLTVRAADTGQGMTREELTNLFQPFISRRYAHLTGGDITVTSTLGEGSAFGLAAPVEKGRVPVQNDWLTKLLTEVCQA